MEAGRHSKVVQAQPPAVVLVVLPGLDESSSLALQAAAEWARRLRADLRILRIVADRPYADLLFPLRSLPTPSALTRAKLENLTVNLRACCQQILVAPAVPFEVQVMVGDVLGCTQVVLARSPVRLIVLAGSQTSTMPGSQHRTFKLARRLVAGTARPVLWTRTRGGPRHVLGATALRSIDDPALQCAAALARLFPAPVSCLHNVRFQIDAATAAVAGAAVLPFAQRARLVWNVRESEQWFRHTAAANRFIGAQLLSQERDTARAILAAVQRLGSDLLILGSPARASLCSWLLPSVAERVLRDYQDSVLLVPS